MSSTAPEKCAGAATGVRLALFFEGSTSENDGKEVLVSVEILYRDSDIAVVVKPAGLLSEDVGEGSLPHALSGTLGTLYPVHRLDRVVGGVMVYARHKKAAAALSLAVTENRLGKVYLAVCEGVPEAPEARLCDLLFKDSRQNKSFVVSTPRRGAREAVLSYKTEGVALFGEQRLARLCVTLETGRSHQIRVQLASRALPLVGDGKYGARVKAKAPALFAKALSFPHPKTGEVMRFEASPPDEFPWSLFAAPLEIEHKYLVKMPDLAWVASRPSCRILSMVQTYLLAPAGETHRVRRIQEGACVRYVETRKRRISALSATEEEREVTLAEYEALLLRADPTRRPIEKTRYQWPYEGHVMELDVYPFWQDRAILEIEVKSEGEGVLLPPELAVIAEVTADKRYKNVNLAKSVPNDDISGK